MSEPRPLTEQELTDWERWSKRNIAWKGEDVARLLATIRDLQAKLEELKATNLPPDDGVC